MGQKLKIAGWISIGAVAGALTTVQLQAVARGVNTVDGLITGFHDPHATHLAMLEAIAGQEQVRSAYAAALESGYLWHEFGDVHLIID